MDEVLTTESWELPFAPERAEIDLVADAFRLTIEACAPGETPKIEARGERRPEVFVRRDGNVVQVRVEHREPGGSWLSWLWGGPPARLVVRVPADVRARVRTHAGKVRVQDLSGCEIDLAADAGSIQINRVRGRVRVSATAGTVDVRDLAGAIDAETEAGTLKLGILSLDPGVHRLRAEAGAVKVDLARGLAVRVDARAMMGSARVDYPTTANADAVLEITASAGSIRVREAFEPGAMGSVVDVEGAGPYRRTSPPARTGAATTSDGAPAREAGPELERVLELVAQGKLSPTDAGELLRAMGHR